MAESGTIRCFIAIELPAEVLRTLADLQMRLGKGSDRAAKWVVPEGIHLTLKFLGDTPAGQVAAVTDAMRRVAEQHAPLALSLAGAGCFPDAGRPRVIWAGLAGDLARLSALQDGMQSAMAGLGFVREARAFTPHLTLARMRDLAPTEDLRRLGSAVSALQVPRVALVANEVALIRSDLLPSGAVYTILARAPLAGTKASGS